MSVHSAASLISCPVTETDRPVASGGGVSCYILLAEPCVFLTGINHDAYGRGGPQNAPALLRGSLYLSVTKNIKVKAIKLKLTGKARTEWPEKIHPPKVDIVEEDTLRTQSLVFFNAMNEAMWATEFGNQCIVQLNGHTGTENPKNSVSPKGPTTSLYAATRPRKSSKLSARNFKRLSFQPLNSSSSRIGANTAKNHVQEKGYKVFCPGTYNYFFELPIDHHQPATTTYLPCGHVKWNLDATVERAGTLKHNLYGTKEVAVVRIPDQLSLEMTAPISISREWGDQMRYDIMISGKTFPIGAKIPIAFKFTPLAKVQIHRLKVFVTENIEYWTNDRRRTGKAPGRKILLFAKDDRQTTRSPIPR